MVNIANAQWQLISPANFSAKTLVIKGDTIYAGYDGVYKSADNGASWTAVNNGLINHTVNALEFNGNNLFAATDGDDGLYLSTDFGANWTARDNGLPGYSNYIATIKTIDSCIFVGNSAFGIYKSTNNGANWIPMNNGNTHNYIYSFIKKDAIIYAGGSNGVCSSINNGANWNNVSTGISNYSLRSMTICGNNIYAGTWGDGVFVSSNDGANWTAINNGIAAATPTIWSLYAIDSNVFAGTDIGLYMLTNNGSYWTNIGLSSYWINSLVMNDSNLYAGTNHGIWKMSLYKITTSSNPSNGGITTGTASYINNQYCTVKAISNTGHTFLNWKENGYIVSIDSNYIFNVTSSRNLVANFSQNLTQYNITTTANPTIGGSVSGSGTYTQNQSCTVKAIHNTAYSFVNWKENNNIVSTDTNYTFSVTANRNLVANFTPVQGITENDFNHINIHPNPAKDNLIIEFEKSKKLQNTSVSIYNTQGQLVKQLTISQPKTEIDIHDLSTGVYVVKVINDKETLQGKFVKE